MLIWRSNRANNQIPNEAKNWLDLSPTEQKLRKAGMISLTAVGIIFLIGMVLLIYLCFTTTSTETNHETGETYQSSNGAFSTFPIMGIVLIEPAFIAGIVGLYESGRTQDSRLTSLLKADLQAAQKLDQAYRDYDRNLRPLLLKQLMTIQEGKEMQMIFDAYRTILDTRNDYKSKTSQEKQAIKANPQQYPEYTAMLTKYGELKKRWKAIYDFKFPPQPTNSPTSDDEED